MEAITKHRSHNSAFKRLVDGEFTLGETLHVVCKQPDPGLDDQDQGGALDEEVQAADLIHECEVWIASLERVVGCQALELILLKRVVKRGSCRMTASGR